RPLSTAPIAVRKTFPECSVSSCHPVFKQEMYRCCKITVVNSPSHQLSADRSSLTPRVYESQLSGRIVGYTEMCIQESEVGGAEVDGFKSYAPFSLPRAHSIPLALRVRTSSLRRR